MVTSNAVMAVIITKETVLEVTITQVHQTDTHEHQADDQLKDVVAGGTSLGNITSVSILLTVSHIHPCSRGSNSDEIDSAMCV